MDGTGGEGVIDGEKENLSTHVSACLHRYERLYRRLARIEYMILAMLSVLVVSSDGPLINLIAGYFLG